MKTIRFPKSKVRLGAAAVVLLALIAASRSDAGEADTNKMIDFRADALHIDGGKKSTILDGAVWVEKAIVYEGSTVSLTCDYSANLVNGTYWKTNVNQRWQVIVREEGKFIKIGYGWMPAGTELGTKKTSSSGLRAPSLSNPVPYESSTNVHHFGTSFKGSLGPVKVNKSLGVGEHKFECVIPKTGFEEPNLSNNVTTAYIEVRPHLKAGPSGPLVARSEPVLPSKPLKAGNSGPARATGTAMAKGPPDITSDPRVVVAGKTAAWGGTVLVDAKRATSVAAGQCEFAIRHTARNAGMSPAGRFGSLWTNNPATGKFRRSWLPLPPGGASTQTDLVMLKAGRNTLRLTLDDTNQVGETNEKNNVFRITVNVTGHCGTDPARVKPSSPLPAKIPRVPVPPVR